MAGSYQVDPDALFSDEEEGASFTPSPKRARVTPVAPRAPSLGPLKLPSYGTASLAGRSAAPPGTSSFSSYSSQSTDSSSTNPYSRVQSTYSRPRKPYNVQSRPPFARGSTIRPSSASHNPPFQPPRPYTAPSYPTSCPPRGPMGRGRAATLPAHVTQRFPPQPERENQSAREKSIFSMASILPEADRAEFIEKKMKERQGSSIGPSPSSGRKRPSRRRSTDEQSAQRVLANLKNSRKGKFKGLGSLLQAAQNSSKNLIQLEGSKHRVHRPEKAHSVYAEATMTKEMVEREERERIQRERELEEERERVHLHFREMREREREERDWMANNWRSIETVAAGMRWAYRLAKAERHLFGEEKDTKRRTQDYWGLMLLPMEEDEMVTEIMTIHVEEI